MCEYCHSYPHMHGCPNEDEPKKVFECAHCETDIHDGEDFVDFDGTPYCSDCFYEAAPDILKKYAKKVTPDSHSLVGIIGKCPCGEDILADETYYEYDGVIFQDGKHIPHTYYVHEDCIDECAFDILDLEATNETAEDDSADAYDDGDDRVSIYWDD